MRTVLMLLWVVLTICIGDAVISAFEVPRPEKPARKQFVFKMVDRKSHLSILVPMTPVNIGVSLEGGNSQLDDHEILNCEVTEARHVVEVDGKPGTVLETRLVCGERTLVVRGIDFDPK